LGGANSVRTTPLSGSHGEFQEREGQPSAAPSRAAGKRTTDEGTPLPADWQPSPKGRAFAESKGYSPDDIDGRLVELFSAVMKNKLSEDWDAEWEIFVLRQKGWERSPKATGGTAPRSAGGWSKMARGGMR
jgi:hypothetical protein